MVIYPLSANEDRMIRWAARIVPTVAFVIVLLLGAMTFASMQM